jgi:diguanylate cyclase (GGDEF)-like protein
MLSDGGGGEEFITLLINLSEEKIFTVVDRFRRLVENTQLTLDDGRKLSVTVSMGATLARPDDTIETLVERADKLSSKASDAGVIKFQWGRRRFVGSNRHTSS